MKEGRSMSLKVAVVIPAHNEEATIENALRDIAAQSYAADIVVVVNDCSTDGTAAVLERLKDEIPGLAVVHNDVPRLRAGAINCGLEYLRDKPIDLVMAADADSRFDRQLLAAAVASFERFDHLGGVCSTSGVIAPDGLSGPFWRRLEARFLWRLQKLDGAGFDATRTATWNNVQILHGLCTVFRLQAVLAVGGYTPGHMLEDYDLTLRLKKAGWKAMYSPLMKAWTRVPTTFRGFFRQRLRWMRGGMDIILENGINRFTWPDALNHILFFLLLAGLASYFAFMTARRAWHPGLSTHPVPIALAGAGYIRSLYRLKFVDGLDAGDVLLCAVLVPELLVAMALSAFQLAAYYLSIFRRPQKW